MPDCCNFSRSGSYIYVYHNILIKHLMLHFFRTGRNALWECGLLPSRSESFLTILNAQTVRCESPQRTSDGPTGQKKTFRSLSDYAQHMIPFPWHITSYTKSLMTTRRKHSAFSPPPRKTVSMKSFPVYLSWPRDGEGRLPRKGALVQVVALWAQATYVQCKNMSALQSPCGKAETASWDRKHTELCGWQKRNNMVTEC